MTEYDDDGFPDHRDLNDDMDLLEYDVLIVFRRMLEQRPDSDDLIEALTAEIDHRRRLDEARFAG